MRKRYSVEPRQGRQIAVGKKDSHTEAQRHEGKGTLALGMHSALNFGHSA